MSNVKHVFHNLHATQSSQGTIIDSVYQRMKTFDALTNRCTKYFISFCFILTRATITKITTKMLSSKFIT